MALQLEGLVAAPLTPMYEDGSINLDLVKDYAGFLHDNGVVGGFINGTTGEGVSLSTSERLALVEEWKNRAPSDFKLIVHVGHTSFEETKRMIKQAADLGVDAVGAIGPFFFKPRDVNDLVAHCSKEAAVAPEMPYFYYHIPSLSGISFPMLEFLKAADGKIPNLAGIKYTFESLMDFERCRQYKDGKYTMLWGRDEMLLAALVMGCKAAIGSTYNIIAPLYNQMIAAVSDGRIDEAVRLQRVSMDMVQVMIKSSSFFSLMKALLGRQGLDFGPVRSPLAVLRDGEEETMFGELDALGYSLYCCKK